MAGPWPSVLLSHTEGHLSHLPGVCWEGREGSGQKLHNPPKYLRGLCCGASWGLSSGPMCRGCFWDYPQNVTLFHPLGPACPVPCVWHMHFRVPRLLTGALALFLAESTLMCTGAPFSLSHSACIYKHLRAGLEPGWTYSPVGL